VGWSGGSSSALFVLIDSCARQRVRRRRRGCCCCGGRQASSMELTLSLQQWRQPQTVQYTEYFTHIQNATNNFIPFCLLTLKSALFLNFAVLSKNKIKLYSILTIYFTKKNKKIYD
jgi:hypothetical protein